MLQLLARHVRGDHGDMCARDKKENAKAIAEGSRVMSSYETERFGKVWIITEADRSVTTLLRPEDY